MLYTLTLTNRNSKTPITINQTTNKFKFSKNKKSKPVFKFRIYKLNFI